MHVLHLNLFSVFRRLFTFLCIANTHFNSLEFKFVFWFVSISYIFDYFASSSLFDSCTISAGCVSLYTTDC